MLKEMLNQITSDIEPEAVAYISGNQAYSDIKGSAYFYREGEGTLVSVQIQGLPTGEGCCNRQIFGFHIHDSSTCADMASHFNPHNCPHPEHAGDLPPIFGDRNGYGMMQFYTDRFLPKEVINRILVVHRMPDDFKSQPSGNAGTPIACGKIRDLKSCEKRGMKTIRKIFDNIRRGHNTNSDS